MVSVPVHGNREIRVGTLSAILDQPGLTTEEFVSLL
jgi:predicted RNA binding protein YcfA (HicA-like mRNA interferase family)